MIQLDVLSLYLFEEIIQQNVDKKIKFLKFLRNPMIKRSYERSPTTSSTEEKAKFTV